MCVGCGACSVATSGAIPVTIGRFGSYEANLTGVSSENLALGSRVCPWSDESKNEDVIAAEVFPDAHESHDVLGRFMSAYTGRVGPQEDVLQSSSGGLTSWVAVKLLERGDVDGVIHVGPSDNALFAYTVSYSQEELRSKRKSMYYSTSFADALMSVKGDGMTYAFIGVPCFVRSARALCDEIPELKSQMKFFLGLVCGHLKSDSFAELLAWQTGIAPDDLKTVDFRVKNPGRPASRYDFGALAKGDSEMALKPTASLIGGNWGHGVFQLNACNYCDDIFAETADVAFGDAWLPEFEADWRGTNVIVNRNSTIEEILRDANETGEIDVAPIGAEAAATTQSGNFRHRRIGLAVRLADDIAAGKWVPRKRVGPGYTGVTRQRIRLIRKRREISAQSHPLFLRAKREGSLQNFLSSIDPLISDYKKVESGSLLVRASRRIKRMVK